MLRFCASRVTIPRSTLFFTAVALLLLTPQVGATGSSEPLPDAFPQFSRAEQVGEEVPVSYRSPDLTDIGEKATTGPAWKVVLDDPGASYIAPHFSTFDLPIGASVVVSAPDGSRNWTYTGRGKEFAGREALGFWGIHIAGSNLTVELYTTVPIEAGRVVIDRYARGFPDARGLSSGTTESLCGPDDSQWAPCYSGSEPAAYSEARAVARLLINGTGACTGWLMGSGGHLMTNEHCIGSAADAANTDYEFMAEGATCGTNCASWFGCAGTVVATTATLVQLSAPLDYALVLLPTNPTGTYGFLQVRSSGATLNERIYIPQHPQGWGKRIGIASSHPSNPSEFCEVDSLTEPGCSSGAVQDVGYYCDTQGGSSGSPVLGYSDNLVVALHHCRGDIACTSTGGDENRGVPIQAILDDLETVPKGSIGKSGCGPGFCVGDSYCDNCVCYAPDHRISLAFCRYDLMDPACGIGECIEVSPGTWAYCEGPFCDFPVCYTPTSLQSLVMCPCI